MHRAPEIDGPPTTPPPSGSPTSRLGGTLVAASIRHPWLVIALALLLTLGGVYVAATRFAITTETNQLIETHDAWTRDKIAFEEGFPQLSKLIVAVVDGETPELADQGATTLLAALRGAGNPGILAAWRPDGGPFFDRNGLLLLSLDEVRAVTGDLVRQQELLLSLAGDPTLRGLLNLIRLGARQGALDANPALLDRITAVVERVLSGERASLSWQTLMSGRDPEPRELRRFVLIDPALDFEALEPAAIAIGEIRDQIARNKLTPENGIRVRLTGRPRSPTRNSQPSGTERRSISASPPQPSPSFSSSR